MQSCSLVPALLTLFPLQEKVRKVLDIWAKAGTFSSSSLARINTKIAAIDSGVSKDPSASPSVPKGELSVHFSPPLPALRSSAYHSFAVHRPIDHRRGRTPELLGRYIYTPSALRRTRTVSAMRSLRSLPSSFESEPQTSIESENRGAETMLSVSLPLPCPSPTPSARPPLATPLSLDQRPSLGSTTPTDALPTTANGLPASVAALLTASSAPQPSPSQSVNDEVERAIAAARAGVRYVALATFRPSRLA